MKQVYFITQRRTVPEATNMQLLCGSQKAVDRATVLCCSNMSGIDKRKLLVTGESSKPWCYEGISMDSLPVLYLLTKMRG
jgi:hypothetical protein